MFYLGRPFRRLIKEKRDEERRARIKARQKVLMSYGMSEMDAYYVSKFLEYRMKAAPWQG